MAHRLAAALSQLCFAIAGLWALAGALRYVFGVAVTVPLLPPLALEQVQVLPALGMALAFALAGAWAGRAAHGLARRAVSRGAAPAALPSNVALQWTPLRQRSAAEPGSSPRGGATELGR